MHSRPMRCEVKVRESLPLTSLSCHVVSLTCLLVWNKKGCTLSLCNVDINAIALKGNISISDINISQACPSSTSRSGAEGANPSDNGAPRTSPSGEPKKDDPVSSDSDVGARAKKDKEKHPDLDAWLNSFLDGVMLDSLKPQPIGTKMVVAAGVTALTVVLVSKLLF